MIPATNVSLRPFNSLKVDVSCPQLWTINNESDVFDLPQTMADEPPIVLGDGTNILFRSNPDRAVVLAHHKGKKVLDRQLGRVYLAAGEVWDQCVQWSIDENLPGLENLALIPGRVGAAPVQNIGAYGVELSRFLESVSVFDLCSRKIREVPAAACELGYRQSRFKHPDSRHLLILGITLILPIDWQPCTSYVGVEKALLENGRDGKNARDIMHTIRQIRREKIPDHRRVGNAGSFFKNPVVDTIRAKAIGNDYPDMPAWLQDADKTKLSAAWLLDNCGWKGYRKGDAGVSEKHALVIVNYGQATGAQLWSLAEEMTNSVNRKFGIVLEPEPRIIGSGSGT